MSNNIEKVAVLGAGTMLTPFNACVPSGYLCIKSSTFILIIINYKQENLNKIKMPVIFHLIKV